MSKYENTLPTQSDAQLTDSVRLIRNGQSIQAPLQSIEDRIGADLTGLISDAESATAESAAAAALSEANAAASEVSAANSASSALSSANSASADAASTAADRLVVTDLADQTADARDTVLQAQSDVAAIAAQVAADAQRAEDAANGSRSDAEYYEEGRTLPLYVDSVLDPSLWDVTNMKYSSLTLATGTGDTNGSSLTITNYSATLSMPTLGMYVSGPGIAADTYVSSVSGSGPFTVNLSKATTAPGTASAFTFFTPCLVTADQGTATADYVSGNDTIQLTPTGASTIANFPVGALIQSNRLAANTTILSVSGSTAPYAVKTSSQASSSGTAVSTTAGGEPMVSTIISKQKDIKDCEVFACFVPASSTSIASAQSGVYARYLDVSNHLRYRKSYNPANQQVQGQSLFKGATAGSDSASGAEATLLLPRFSRMRFWEDAIAIKEWVSWLVYRGTYSASNTYAVGDGVNYSYVIGSNTIVVPYVCISAVSSGGVSDPGTDPTHWLLCKEPEWQIAQRLRPASAGFDASSTSNFEENIEIGAVGWFQQFLQCSLLRLSVTELVRTPQNLIWNPQLEWVRPSTNWPLGWERTLTASTIPGVSGSVTKVVGSKTLTSVAASGWQAGMGITGSGIPSGARILSYNAGTQTIEMNVAATTAGVITATATNWSGMSEIAGYGHQNAPNTPRRVLEIQNFVGQANGLQQYCWVRGQTPNPFALGRRRPKPDALMPRAIEFDFWTKANNLQLSVGFGSGLSIDIYYYDRNGRLLQLEDLGGSGVGPVDTYYLPVGPNNNGLGTWDWLRTRFWMPVRGRGQVAMLRWNFVLHEACTGQAFVLDPIARPVGGQA